MEGILRLVGWFGIFEKFWLAVPVPNFPAGLCEQHARLAGVVLYIAAKWFNATIEVTEQSSTNMLILVSFSTSFWSEYSIFAGTWGTLHLQCWYSAWCPGEVPRIGVLFFNVMGCRTSSSWNASYFRRDTKSGIADRQYAKHGLLVFLLLVLELLGQYSSWSRAWPCVTIPDLLSRLSHSQQKLCLLFKCDVCCRLTPLQQWF